MRVTAPCPTALRSRGSHIGCHAPASTGVLCARSALKCKTALPRRGVNSPAATDASSAEPDLVTTVAARDASLHTVLSSLAAAVETLTKVTEEQQLETRTALAALAARLPATPVVPDAPAAGGTTDALARAEDEIQSLRQGNAALQAALEHASKLMTTVREEAADARRAREEESQMIAEELQSAHRSTAEAASEVAALRAQVVRLEEALEMARAGGERAVVDDPPLNVAAEGTPAPPAPAPVPAVSDVAADLGAALMAARERAKAADEQLSAARSAAANLVASAPQWNR